MLAATLDLMNPAVNVWWLWAPAFILSAGFAMKRSYRQRPLNG